MWRDFYKRFNRKYLAGFTSITICSSLSYNARINTTTQIEQNEEEKEEERQDPLFIHDTCFNGAMRASLQLGSFHQRSFTIKPSKGIFNLSQNTCQCDSGIRERTTHLSRRNTIRLLKETQNTMDYLRSKYIIDWKKPIGEGAFGAVYKAVNRETGDLLALKKIPKRFTDVTAFQNEINALMHIRDSGGHPGICALIENFEDDKYYYLLLDLISGGEMFDHLIELGAYSEADAARLVREVASALSFLHGIGIVHGDLKPENLMLSTKRKQDSSVKLVDFGCAQDVEAGNHDKNSNPPSLGKTPAYCPPEVLAKVGNITNLLSAMDIWSLGIILYIMLTGLHPFDLNANASDEDIESRIISKQAPPLRNSPITAHLSPSAIDVIEKCIAWNPRDRITAIELLNHPWVRGETANQNKMQDASKKLSMYRQFKSKLEAKVFAQFFSYSDEGLNSISKKSSLMERAFHSFDTRNTGFLTSQDLMMSTEEDTKERCRKKKEDGETLSLSEFSNLLGENMKNRYFPRGHTVYSEGDIGDHMYFINSGVIEVVTKDGSISQRHHGDLFGEGALLHPQKIRSATIRCLTPVHAIEISREYFEKYLASSGVALDLKEKDRTRKRNRAKTILHLQQNLKPMTFQENDVIFSAGEPAEAMYLLEKGNVDVLVENKRVFTVKPGDIFGEHSLIMSRPRNTSAKCMGPSSCQVYKMMARDFYQIYNSSSSVRNSLREVCLRREFQKALVKKTNKEFPSVKDLRKVFDASDTNGSGSLDFEEVQSLLHSFDKSLSDEEIREVLSSLDLSKDGKIGFEEFRVIFGMDDIRASSI
jgi:serine/threonine protein kinase